MSFFQKDDTQKNLQYDDIAFLHFSLTFTIVASIFFFVMIVRKCRQANIKRIKNYKNLKNSGLFKPQLQNQKLLLKQKHITKSFYIMLILLISCILLSIFLTYFISTQKTQMITFDPYQILGVQNNAPVNVIKKSYRKLALIYHPDRNPDDPEAHTKFIMISKSYQCLTDQKKKENCLKFGNPDGETSFQVGIGLPQFIIKKENQNFIIPAMLFFVLILIPISLIRLSNSIKTKDNIGLYAEDYAKLYPFFLLDNFNASFGFYLLSVLKQLETQKRLTGQQKQKLFQYLSTNRLIEISYVSQTCTQSQLYLLFKLFKQMVNCEPDLPLSKKIPLALNSLIKFSTIFAQASNNQKSLQYINKPIYWIGCQHIFMFLQFIKTYYTCSLIGKNLRLPFDYLDLSEEDSKISLENKVENFKELLTNKEKRQQHLSLFTQKNREYIEKQLMNLPLMSLEVKLVLEKQTIKEFTAYDFPEIQVKVKKLNQTAGYCYLKNFPYLKEEKFYFMLLYRNNLLTMQQITFQQDQTQIVKKIPYRQGAPGQYKFHAFLTSDCYYDLDTRTQFSFKVIQANEQQANKKVQIHPDDLNIQKLQKSSLEQMLNLSLEDPEDGELSDDQTDDSNNNYQRKEGGCCDHEHGHTHGQKKSQNGIIKKNIMEEESNQRDDKQQ